MKDTIDELRALSPVPCSPSVLPTARPGAASDTESMQHVSGVSASASGSSVAALCVAVGSVYRSIHGVECYDKRRDVRSFAGGMPVVAHPVCAPWSAYCAHQWKPLPGEKELGPLCVEWLRKCGGVLEHPAHSRLFDHCGLPRPGTQKGDLWTVEVSQAWWGYSMLKKTWLCFAGIPRELVTIPFCEHDPRSGEGDRRRQQRMSKNQRAATHPAFAEWLVEQARKTLLTNAC